MRKNLTIFALFLAVTAVKVSCADQWPQAVEKDYFSENGRFVAHVTPAKEKEKPLLEVFEVKGTERVPLWQCKLNNEVAPVEVYMSDDGGYVVTNNEWHRVGYGDYVIAFYNKDGRIKNYSMEQILHLPKNISSIELYDLVPHSVSSRWWDESSIKFLDTCGGRLYFCVWLDLFDHWQAWNVEDGREIKVDKTMIERWNNKGRMWARKDGIKSKSYHSALRFLGKLKITEDQEVIESFLTAKDFYTHHMDKWMPGKQEFVHYYCRSPKRVLAERILAEWNGKSTKKYHYLGVVEGTVKLPTPPKAGDRWLCIYLIPSTTAKEKWYSKLPVHRLTAYFGKYSFHNRQWPGSNIPFSIQGVTPGQYWVKAVWDKAEPYSFDDKNIKGPPQQGDYESLESPTITVRAGKTVEKIIIDCTNKVTNGTD